MIPLGLSSISYLNIGDVIAVPCSPEELISEPEYEQVLDHFLPEIVVDSEELLFLPIRCQGFLKCPRALEIFAKRLLYLWGWHSLALTGVSSKQGNNGVR